MFFFYFSFSFFFFFFFFFFFNYFYYYYFFLIIFFLFLNFQGSFYIEVFAVRYVKGIQDAVHKNKEGSETKEEGKEIKAE